MARQLRIQYPGAVYHVMSRGDRREAIFADVRNDYDDFGRLIKHTDADGHVITYNLDTTNRVETITDRLNNATAYAYDTRGTITTATNALGQVTRFMENAQFLFSAQLRIKRVA